MNTQPAPQQPSRSPKVIFGLLILLVLLGGALFYKMTAQNENDSAGAQEQTGNSGGGPESMGDPMSENGQTGVSENEKKRVFLLIISNLHSCLGITSGAPLESLPISVESMLSTVQGQLGPATQLERWVEWRFKKPDGVEHRYRMEINETDEGVIRRELQEFKVEADGTLSNVESAQSKQQNPSEESVDTLVKNDQLLNKERAGAALFVTGEKLEYTEVNGTLFQFEFERGTHLYRCKDLKSTQSCQCH